MIFKRLETITLPGPKYRVIQVKLDVTKQLFQTENNQWGSKMGFVHVLLVGKFVFLPLEWILNLGAGLHSLQHLVVIVVRSQKKHNFKLQF